jgi:hypothetical protein
MAKSLEARRMRSQRAVAVESKRKDSFYFARISLGRYA